MFTSSRSSLGDSPGVKANFRVSMIFTAQCSLKSGVRMFRDRSKECSVA